MYPSLAVNGIIVEQDGLSEASSMMKRSGLDNAFTVAVCIGRLMASPLSAPSCIVVVRRSSLFRDDSLSMTSTTPRMCCMRSGIGYYWLANEVAFICY